jgi:predicted membrane channel-forming protein YqfA (hemolysin III family)
MHTISWNAETSKAVTRMDRLGIYILIAYLLFSILRGWIFSHWLHGYTLTAFSLSVGAGGMLGRLYTTRHRIRQVLKEEGFLHPGRRSDTNAKQ